MSSKVNFTMKLIYLLQFSTLVLLTECTRFPSDDDMRYRPVMIQDPRLQDRFLFSVQLGSEKKHHHHQPDVVVQQVPGYMPDHHHETPLLVPGPYAAPPVLMQPPYVVPGQAPNNYVPLQGV